MAISDGLTPAIVLATVAVNAAAVDGWLFHWLAVTPCSGCSTVKVTVTAVEGMADCDDCGEAVAVIGIMVIGEAVAVAREAAELGWADGRSDGCEEGIFGLVDDGRGGAASAVDGVNTDSCVYDDSADDCLWG